MAVGVFINLQIKSYNIKEPYMSYASFLRIENALKKCIRDAQPHLFHTGNSTYNNKTKEYCDNHLVKIQKKIFKIFTFKKNA